MNILSNPSNEISIKFDNLLKNTIAIGELTLSAHDIRVSEPLIYVLEDDVYVYIYAPRIGAYAYGSDISSAQNNLVEAVSANFQTLYNENRLEAIYSNHLDSAYLDAYNYYQIKFNKSDLTKIAENHFRPENTEVIHSSKKGPQLYEIYKDIKVSIQSKEIKKVA